MPYCQLYYHLVWATKLRAPLLTAQVELAIYGYIRSKAVGLGGMVYALNGTADHVHLVATIPPSIAVAQFIGQVKGVASTRLNKSGLSELPFFWQAEYGVFSFDRKRLANHVAYVVHQKSHHRDQHLIPVLERVGDEDVNSVSEPSEIYAAGDAVWWAEMLRLTSGDPSDDEPARR